MSNSTGADTRTLPECEGITGYTIKKSSNYIKFLFKSGNRTRLQNSILLHKWKSVPQLVCI